MNKNQFDISDLVSSAENYEATDYQEFSTVPNPKKPFSFNLAKNKIEWLRNFVAFKRKTPAFFHYNNSSALREGIEIMREKYPIERRPKEIENPIRLGRPYFLDEQDKKKKTSFIISQADREYIYDFIYKYSADSEFFGKENFFEYIIEVLSNTYKIKKDD